MNGISSKLKTEVISMSDNECYHNRDRKILFQYINVNMNRNDIF